MTSVQDLSRTARESLVSGKSATTVSALAAALDQHALEGKTFGDESAATMRAMQQLRGFGVLQPFLDDPEIEEIWCNRPNEVFIASHSGVRRFELPIEAEDLRTIAFRMLRDSGRRVDRSLPFVDAALPDGSRLHIVIPDVTARHWSINIRKFPTRIWSFAQLEEMSMISTSQRNYLAQAVRLGKNILVSGATHSGKTTMLCAALLELPVETRLITCEETFEIRSELHDWVAMQTRQPNLEGVGEIPLRRLVKEALRMRPGRLVIGEVREAESLDLLIAMNSGVPGMCTIHANNAAAALTKLCTLPLLAGPNISSEFVRATVAQSLDLVVHCKQLSDGSRRVSEIARVTTDISGYPVLEAVPFE